MIEFVLNQRAKNYVRDSRNDGLRFEDDLEAISAILLGNQKTIAHLQELEAKYNEKVDFSEHWDVIAANLTRVNHLLTGLVDEAGAERHVFVACSGLAQRMAGLPGGQHLSQVRAYAVIEATNRITEILLRTMWSLPLSDEPASPTPAVLPA